MQEVYTILHGSLVPDYVVGVLQGGQWSGPWPPRREIFLFRLRALMGTIKHVA